MSLSYPCNCIGHSPQAAEAVPRSDKLNGAGSLAQWARPRVNVASSSTANQAAPRLCGGKVKVTVLDDNTHSLNILGQQIIVHVEHPI